MRKTKEQLAAPTFSIDKFDFEITKEGLVIKYGVVDNEPVASCSMDKAQTANFIALLLYS